MDPRSKDVKDARVSRERLLGWCRWAGMVLFYLVLLQRISPLELFNGHPWYAVNWGRYYYAQSAAVGIGDVSGSIRGYDPRAACGMVFQSGVLQGLGFIERFFRDQGLPTVVNALKTSVFLGFAMVPFTFLWALRRHRREAFADVAGILGLTAYVFFSPSYFLVYTSTPAGVFLWNINFLLCGLVPWMDRGQRRLFLGSVLAGLLVSLAMQVSPISALFTAMLFPAACIWLVFVRGKGLWRGVLALVLYATAVMVPALLTRTPNPFPDALEFVGILARHPDFPRVSFGYEPWDLVINLVKVAVYPLTLLQVVYLWRPCLRKPTPSDAPAKGYFTVFLSLWLLGIGGLCVAEAVNRSVQRVPLTLPVTIMERFLDSLLVLGTLPLALSANRLVRRLRQESRLASTFRWGLIGMAVLAMVSIPWPSLETTPPPPYQAVLARLSEAAPEAGRLLVEGAPHDPPWGFEPGNYLAVDSGLECAHIVTNESFDFFSNTSFVDGLLLINTPIEAYTEGELLSILQNMAVEFILVHTSTSRKVFAGMPQHFREDSTYDGYTLFTVREKPTRFLTGRGQVRATFNRIELTDLQAEDGNVVVAYHYARGWQADSGQEVHRHPTWFDPLGFIRLKDPPERVILTYHADFRSPVFTREDLMAWEQGILDRRPIVRRLQP